MKLRVKDNQPRLTKKMDKALARLQHQESEDGEENWNSLNAITYDTAVSVLGELNRKHHDWLDDRDKKRKEVMQG